MTFVFDKNDKFILKDFLGEKTIVMKRFPFQYVSISDFEFAENYGGLSDMLDLSAILNYSPNKEDWEISQIISNCVFGLFHFFKENILKGICKHDEKTIRVKLRVLISKTHSKESEILTNSEKLLLQCFFIDFTNELLQLKAYLQSNAVINFGRIKIESIPLPNEREQLPF